MSQIAQKRLRSSRYIVGCLLFLVAYSSLTSSSSQASQVAWRKVVPQATAEAKKLNKRLLLQVTATWCPACHQMLSSTYTNARIIAHVNRYFVPVAIDADQNAQMIESLGIDALPTTIIVSPDFKEIKRLTGFQSVEDFDQQLAELAGSQDVESTLTSALIATLTVPVKSTIGFDGFCLVSLRDDETLTQGDAQYIAEYRGVALQFASAEKRDLFLANPKRYWPKYNGRCLVTTEESQKSKIGSPRWSVRYQQRLWFFTSEANMQAFLETPLKYLHETPDGSTANQ